MDHLVRARLEERRAIFLALLRGEGDLHRQEDPGVRDEFERIDVTGVDDGDAAVFPGVEFIADLLGGVEDQARVHREVEAGEILQNREGGLEARIVRDAFLPDDRQGVFRGIEDRLEIGVEIRVVPGAEAEVRGDEQIEGPFRPFGGGPVMAAGLFVAQKSLAHHFAQARFRNKSLARSRF